MVELEAPPEDGREAWARLRGELGPSFSVEPVFSDPRGESAFPTGVVIVRFRGPMSHEQSEQFASSHGLEVQGTSKFAPQQVMFRQRNPSRRYLPDLLAALEGEPDVVAAWPETRIAIRRAANGGH